MFRLSRPINSIYRTNIVSFNSRRLLGDGAKGQITWPLPSYLFKNYTHATRNLIGWTLAFLSILIIWPTTIVEGFNIAHHVPSYSGSQVKLKRTGLDKFDTDVEILKLMFILVKQLKKKTDAIYSI